MALPAAPRGLVDLVVIGISTGKPQALKYLIPQLPAIFSAPMAIVLHMPVEYTALYADKLNKVSNLQPARGKKCRPVQEALAAPADNP